MNVEVIFGQAGSVHIFVVELVKRAVPEEVWSGFEVCRQDSSAICTYALGKGWRFEEGRRRTIGGVCVDIEPRNRRPGSDSFDRGPRRSRKNGRAGRRARGRSRGRCRSSTRGYTLRII